MQTNRKQGLIPGFDPDQAFPVLSEACEVVILKLGAEGSWIRKGEEMIKISALPVKCNDTTGAGDLYAAGFPVWLCKGLNLETCGIIGSFMAGKVIEIIGARMNREQFAEIKKYIINLADDH